MTIAKKALKMVYVLLLSMAVLVFAQHVCCYEEFEMLNTGKDEIIFRQRSLCRAIQFETLKETLNEVKYRFLHTNDPLQKKFEDPHYPYALQTLAEETKVDDVHVVTVIGVLYDRRARLALWSADGKSGEELKSAAENLEVKVCNATGSVKQKLKTGDGEGKILKSIDVVKSGLFQVLGTTDEWSSSLGIKEPPISKYINFHSPLREMYAAKLRVSVYVTWDNPVSLCMGSFSPDKIEKNIQFSPDNMKDDLVHHFTNEAFDTMRDALQEIGMKDREMFPSEAGIWKTVSDLICGIQPTSSFVAEWTSKKSLDHNNKVVEVKIAYGERAFTIAAGIVKDIVQFIASVMVKELWMLADSEEGKLFSHMDAIYKPNEKTYVFVEANILSQPTK